MHGSGVLTHSANAFCVILTNLSALSRFALSHAPLAMMELPYGFTPRVLPGKKAHVSAELASKHVVQIEKGRRGIDGACLERAELGIGVDVDPGHRAGVDAELFRQRRPHGARTVTGGVADLLAGEV